MNKVLSVVVVVTKKDTSTQDVCIIVNTELNNYNGCAEFRANVPKDIADKFNAAGNCLRIKCDLYWVKHWVGKIYELDECGVTIINAF